MAYAEQRLSEGKGGPAYLMRGIARPLWERGLRSTFHSSYKFAVNDFLGSEIGTIDATTMKASGTHQWMKQSVLRELKDGKLPVNKNHDELRVLSPALDKNAADQALREAIALGMPTDLPRADVLA